jgi:hypothetical protein
LVDLDNAIIKYDDKFVSVLSGFKSGGSFSEGAEYVLDVVTEYPGTFPKGAIFEFTTKNTVDNIRRVDVKVGDIYYEMKSTITFATS